jgi:hypothetical protein
MSGFLRKRQKIENQKLTLTPLMMAPTAVSDISDIEVNNMDGNSWIESSF